MAAGMGEYPKPQTRFTTAEIHLSIEVQRLRNELSDIKNGAEIVIPSSKGHAQNMELVAKRWLKDNT